MAFEPPIAPHLAAAEAGVRLGGRRGPGEVEMRSSREGKYLSLTVTINATSREKFLETFEKVNEKAKQAKAAKKYMCAMKNTCSSGSKGSLEPFTH